MDDFMFMANSREAALILRDCVEALLHRLGVKRNPSKGLWEPTQVGDHLGLTTDLLSGEFRAPIDKLQALSKHASALLGGVATTARCLPARLRRSRENRNFSASPSRHHVSSSANCTPY
jgi:hypothetical protein